MAGWGPSNRAHHSRSSASRSSPLTSFTPTRRRTGKTIWQFEASVQGGQGDLLKEDLGPLRLDLELSPGHPQVRRPAHGHPVQPDGHGVALRGDDERVPLPDPLLDVVLAAKAE